MEANVFWVVIVFLSFPGEERFIRYGYSGFLYATEARCLERAAELAEVLAKKRCTATRCEKRTPAAEKTHCHDGSLWYC
jgi:hypothetical protein